MRELDGDHALHLHPPPWSKEGKDIEKVARRAVPVAELWRLNNDMRRQLGLGT